MSYINKVVIITGGASGIGAAIVRIFAKEKANIVILDKNLKGLLKITSECEQINGIKPLSLEVDIIRDDDLKEAIEKVIRQYGKIDILINNAGVQVKNSIFSENLMEIYDYITPVNFRAVVHLTHLTAPYLIETKGCIINIASILSKGVCTELIYPATKAAIEHFSKCVALELAPKGVRVNCVLPGPVYTNILQNNEISEARCREIFTKIGEKTPLGKAIEPEEIGDLVIFLASDKAKSITGSSFVIDNGSLLRDSQRFFEFEI